MISEFQVSTVAYNLVSPTVPLDEIFFPSVVVCNMNTLRKSFVFSMLRDRNLKDLKVDYEELRRLFHLVFIDGGDDDLSGREKEIIRSKN
jgi:hypothetical protein